MRTPSLVLVLCCLMAISPAALGASWVQGQVAFLDLHQAFTGSVHGNLTVAVDGDDLVFTFKTPLGLPLLPNLVMFTHVYVGAAPPTDPNPYSFPYGHDNVNEQVDEVKVPLEEVGVDCGDTVYFSAYAITGCSAGPISCWAYDDDCPEIEEGGPARYCSVVLPCTGQNGGTIPMLPTLAFPAGVLALVVVPAMKARKKG